MSKSAIELDAVLDIEYTRAHVASANVGDVLCQVKVKCDILIGVVECGVEIKIVLILECDGLIENLTVKADGASASNFL